MIGGRSKRETIVSKRNHGRLDGSGQKLLIQLTENKA